MVVKWLGLGAFTAEGPGLILMPCRGTRHAAWHTRACIHTHTHTHTHSLEKRSLWLLYGKWIVKIFFFSPKGHVFSEWTDALVWGRVSSFILWLAPRSIAFCHWLNKHVLRTCSLPGTVLNTGDAETKKLRSLWGEPGLIPGSSHDSCYSCYHLGCVSCSCSVQFSSVTQCVWLCNPMDCSTPGFLVHHHLPEFAQTHVRQVTDAIQPSHALSSPSPPAFNPSQHQGLFQWVSFSHQVTKILELQHQSSQGIFRTDFL